MDGIGSGIGWVEDLDAQALAAHWADLYCQVDATGTHRLTRQAGHAWWHTLTDTPERTIHLAPTPRITLDRDDNTADAN